MEELIHTLQSLFQRDWITYANIGIPIILSCLTIGVLCYQNKIASKQTSITEKQSKIILKQTEIAEQQNKIALYERRQTVILEYKKLRALRISLDVIDDDYKRANPDLVLLLSNRKKFALARKIPFIKENEWNHSDIIYAFTLEKEKITYTLKEVRFLFKIDHKIEIIILLADMFNNFISTLTNIQKKSLYNDDMEEYTNYLHEYQKNKEKLMDAYDKFKIDTFLVELETQTKLL